MPTPSPGRDPLQTLLSLAWTVLFVCLLLWAAVWLLQQIWAWLVAGLVLTAAVLLLLAWWRARRDSW